MVQLQVILGKAGIFLALYTTHCTLQSSAQGPKNVESPNDSELSQLCWAAGVGISLVLRTWHRNPPTLFIGVWGLHMHLLKEFNLFSIQMLIHAYLPLGKQDKCFHLQTEKAASDQKSCHFSSKTVDPPESARFLLWEVPCHLNQTCRDSGKSRRAEHSFSTPCHG